MKNLRLLALALLASASLTGCASKSGQPDSKQVARIKSRALNVGGFLANLAGNILVNTARNYANERLGLEATQEPEELRGFSK